MNEAWLARRFAQFVPDTIKRVWDDVLAAILNAWAVEYLAELLADDLRVTLNDALRIEATEAMDAYRDGTLSVYRDNRDLVVGWRWRCGPDACEACRALDGSVHSLDEDQEGPHPRCRCGQEPLFASEQLEEV